MIAFETTLTEEINKELITSIINKMNPQEEKTKLEKEVEAIENRIASDQISLSVAKSKLKKINKIIAQAEEALK